MRFGIHFGKAAADVRKVAQLIRSTLLWCLPLVVHHRYADEQMTSTWVQCSCCCWRRYFVRRLATAAQVQSSLTWFRGAMSAEPPPGRFVWGRLQPGLLTSWVIPESRGQHVGWDNFLTTPPHPAIEAIFYWQLRDTNPDSAHVFGTVSGVR